VRAAIAVAVVTLLFAQARTASAQSNYRTTIGGRTTLMGTTGLNFGTDGSAPFMNPATLAIVDTERLTFSVNFYTFTAFHARKWYQPGEVDSARFGAPKNEGLSLTDLEFNALPSSLCLFLSSSRTSRLALCAAATQNSSFTFASERAAIPADATRLTRLQQTMLISFSRFAVGPTYALALADNVSIGATITGTFVMHRSAIVANSDTHGAMTTPISSSFYSGSRGDALQLHALAGITYRFGKQSVAFAIESPSLHVFGVGAANLHTDYSGSGAAVSRSVGVDGSFVSSTPLRVGIGAGFAGEKGTAELNLFAYAPMSSAYEADLAGTEVRVINGVATEERASVLLKQRADPVLNAAIGGEYLLTPKLSVLGGFSTDFSSAPKSEPRGDLLNYHTARSHRVAASFGFGSHTEDGELHVGTELSYFWGQRLVVNSFQLPPTLAQVNHGTFTALLVVAGSTSLSSIRRAMSDAADAWRKK